MAAVFKSVSHDVAADVLRRIDWADAGNILVRMEDRSAIGNHFYRVDRVGMLNKRTCREHEFCGSPISASFDHGNEEIVGRIWPSGMRDASAEEWIFPAVSPKHLLVLYWQAQHRA